MADDPLLTSLLAAVVAVPEAVLAQHDEASPVTEDIERPSAPIAILLPSSQSCRGWLPAPPIWRSRGGG
jgi:hypothetical protein